MGTEPGLSTSRFLARLPRGTRSAWDRSSLVNVLVILFSLGLILVSLRAFSLRPPEPGLKRNAVVPFAAPRRVIDAPPEDVSSLEFTPRVETEALEGPPTPAPPPRAVLPQRPPAPAPAAPAPKPVPPKPAPEPRLAPTPWLQQGKGSSMSSGAFLAYPPDARGQAKKEKEGEAKAAQPAPQPEASAAAAGDSSQRRSMSSVVRPSGQ
ncbi:MAG TPA: hypothetical protein VNI01_03695 [Elusimicrobiota bacterium]|jgi:colicin import membrane protein|nr:hypothetical protein [Elusimicrobiota bacterium]